MTIAKRRHLLLLLAAGSLVACGVVIVAFATSSCACRRLNAVGRPETHRRVTPRPRTVATAKRRASLPVLQSSNCLPGAGGTMTNAVSHLCGFADATNTGVPAGTTLYRVPQDITGPTAQTGYGWSWNGSYIVLGAGGLLTNVRLSGNDVSVEGSNATVQNSDFASVNAWSIALRHVRNVTIKNNNMHGVGNVSGSNACDQAVVDIYGDSDNVTIENNNVWWCADALNNISNGGLIEQNYIHDLVYATSGSHIEALHMQPGNGTLMTVRDNTFLNPQGQTAALIFSNDSGPAVTNVDIDHNLFAGGGYCVYLGNPSGQTPSSNITFANNHFSRIYHSTCGYWGPVVYWDGPGNGDVRRGNVWDDTGRPLDRSAQ